MSRGFRVQRAGERDLSEIMAILEDRRDWLQIEKQSDQWVDVASWRTLVVYLIRHANMWVAVTDDQQGEVVGCIAVTTEPDFDFWSEEQRATPALYVSKLATALPWAGNGLGGVLLDWAVDHAARLGLTVVRLDTWIASSGLHEYYVKRDWRHVGTIRVGSRRSGTLFEKPIPPPVSFPSSDQSVAG